MANGKRSPEEIRAAIEANRAEFGVAVERLRVEVTGATDWRRRVRENHQNIVIGAAAAGFVLGGGIPGILGIFKRG